jgi:Asp-tRNA(Asn)/Glu-tRNA(Gln) amidotransferase C subunit
LTHFYLFGASQLSPIFFDLWQKCSEEEIIKIFPWKRPVLTSRTNFDEHRLSLIWERNTQEEAAPGEEPKSVLCVRFGAEEDELLKAESGRLDRSDDPEVLNSRSKNGRSDEFARLEMSAEEIEKKTDGFEGLTEVFEETTKVFEERAQPELFEASKPSRIVEPSISSGEFRKMNRDVKKTIETLDDRQPLPEPFLEDDDEPEARREEQKGTR